MYQLHVKSMIYYCNIVILMEIEKSKVSIQFLLIFRQSGDVLLFLFARRLRGYTATGFYKIMGFLKKLEAKKIGQLLQSCQTLVKFWPVPFRCQITCKKMGTLNRAEFIK